MFFQGDIKKVRQAVNWAVEAGYRHIDTAALYRNEEEVGKGISDVLKKGLVRREDLFVTTKVTNSLAMKKMKNIAQKPSHQKFKDLA